MCFVLFREEEKVAELAAAAKAEELAAAAKAEAMAAGLVTTTQQVSCLIRVSQCTYYTAPAHSTEMLAC